MRCNVTFRCTLPVDLDKHPPGEELAVYIADKMTQSGLKTSVVIITRIALGGSNRSPIKGCHGACSGTSATA